MCHGKSDFEGKVVIVTKETDYYINLLAPEFHI